VINLDIEIVQQVCREKTATGENIYISAYDSPTQCSISGHTDILMKTARELEKKGAIVYPLKLNGPFHSPLMQSAADKMKSILEQYNYIQPQYQVIANRNAQPYENAESVVENLSLQLISPIRWQASIQYLLDQGVEIAVEIGPKNVLKFLMPKNTDKILTFTTDNQKDLDLIREDLLIPPKDYTQIIGKCLGAAVSTKNRNDDNKEYEENVIKPYRKIEAYYNKFVSNEEKPNKDHVKEALNVLKIILATKKVPQQEQDFWINRVFGNKVLSL
jgi:[acyl-carrier-protein] S-malonyltransferase